MVRRKAALAFLALALAVAPPAMAQDTQSEEYGGQVPNLISGSGPDGAAGSGVAGDAASGNLPFTGLDIALITLGGAALLGTGIALRMRSRKADQ